MIDPRASAAAFYDYEPDPLDDIPFYLGRLPSPNAHVLELGCGTGRVTIPLAAHCDFIQGIDHSEAMLQICRDKIAAAGLQNVDVQVGDITHFQLYKQFDFIIAPYRVLQNLETDEQLRGLFAGIRKHLRADGRCILNTFHLNGTREEIIERWSNPEEYVEWEVPTEDGRIACVASRSGVQLEPLVLRPVLRHRRYRGDTLVEESLLRFVMRCYTPDQLVALVEAEGFRITDTFGGYAGEVYGQGTELVVEFDAAR